MEENPPPRWFTDRSQKNRHVPWWTFRGILYGPITPILVWSIWWDGPDQSGSAKPNSSHFRDIIIFKNNWFFNKLIIEKTFRVSPISYSFAADASRRTTDFLSPGCFWNGFRRTGVEILNSQQSPRTVYEIDRENTFRIFKYFRRGRD